MITQKRPTGRPVKPLVDKLSAAQREKLRLFSPMGRTDESRSDLGRSARGFLRLELVEAAEPVGSGLALTEKGAELRRELAERDRVEAERNEAAAENVDAISERNKARVARLSSPTPTSPTADEVEALRGLVGKDIAELVAFADAPKLRRLRAALETFDEAEAWRDAHPVTLAVRAACSPFPSLRFIGQETEILESIVAGSISSSAGTNAALAYTFLACDDAQGIAGVVALADRIRALQVAAIAAGSPTPATWLAEDAPDYEETVEEEAERETTPSDFGLFPVCECDGAIGDDERCIKCGGLVDLDRDAPAVHLTRNERSALADLVAASRKTAGASVAVAETIGDALVTFGYATRISEAFVGVGAPFYRPTEAGDELEDELATLAAALAPEPLSAREHWLLDLISRLTDELENAGETQYPAVTSINIDTALVDEARETLRAFDPAQMTLADAVV